MLVRVGISLLLAFLVWRQVTTAVALYFLWLGAALLYVLYQGRFALAQAHDRPLKYDFASNTLFVLDLLAHFAVAAFCGVGWIGIGLVVFAYFWSGRLARFLAVSRAEKDILRILGKNEPTMGGEERAGLARVMLEQRMRRFAK